MNQVPKMAGMINQQLGNIAADLDDLEKLILDLEDRLGPISVKSTENCTEKPPTPPICAPELAGRLQVIDERIMKFTFILSNLKNSIDL